MRKVNSRRIQQLKPAEFRALRERIGTQKIVADIMGVSRKTLACWEIGYHPILRMAVVLMRLLEREQAGPKRSPADRTRTPRYL